MKSPDKPTDYSFILRLWQIQGEEVQGEREEQWFWRASLDDPQTGDRVGFTDLEALFAYIREKTRLNRS
jgi:hypothetical protein